MKNASQSGLTGYNVVFRYMESILKGRESQNDFNSCSKGKTMKVTLVSVLPSYIILVEISYILDLLTRKWSQSHCVSSAITACPDDVTIKVYRQSKRR